MSGVEWEGGIVRGLVGIEWNAWGGVGWNGINWNRMGMMGWLDTDEMEREKITHPDW